MEVFTTHIHACRRPKEILYYASPRSPWSNTARIASWQEHSSTAHSRPTCRRLAEERRGQEDARAAQALAQSLVLGGVVARAAPSAPSVASAVTSVSATVATTSSVRDVLFVVSLLRLAVVLELAYPCPHQISGHGGHTARHRDGASSSALHLLEHRIRRRHHTVLGW